MLECQRVSGLLLEAQRKSCFWSAAWARRMAGKPLVLDWTPKKLMREATMGRRGERGMECIGVQPPLDEIVEVSFFFSSPSFFPFLPVSGYFLV